MSVQHLQQQVVQRHLVLALHAIKVLHAFVAAGSMKETERLIYQFVLQSVNISVTTFSNQFLTDINWTFVGDDS